MAQFGKALFFLFGEANWHSATPKSEISLFEVVFGKLFGPSLGKVPKSLPFWVLLGYTSFVSGVFHVQLLSVNSKLLEPLGLLSFWFPHSDFCCWSQLSLTEPSKAIQEKQKGARQRTINPTPKRATATVDEEERSPRFVWVEQSNPKRSGAAYISPCRA